jgi:hypothetical protein
MQADAVAGNAFDAPVDGCHVQFKLPEEISIAQTVEEPMPLHRQVGRIDLQDQPGIVDRPILVGQRVRQGHHICLVAVVMLVEHRCGNDTG